MDLRTIASAMNGLRGGSASPQYSATSNVVRSLAASPFRLAFMQNRGRAGNPMLTRLMRQMPALRYRPIGADIASLFRGLF